MLQNKLVTILSVLLFSFFISTISLAVKKNNTRAELRSCYAEYEEYKTNCSDAKLPGVTDTTTTVVTTTTHQTPVTPDVSCLELKSTFCMQCFFISFSVVISDMLIRPNLNASYYEKYNKYFSIFIFRYCL